MKGDFMSTRDLISIDDLDHAIHESLDKPVFLFKHSTRCPVSFKAQSQYMKFIEDNNENDEIIFTHLDLIKYRNISDEIAKRFDVDHQSPQAILIKNEKAVWHASHYDINQDSLTEALS